MSFECTVMQIIFNAFYVNLGRDGGGVELFIP